MDQAIEQVIAMRVCDVRDWMRHCGYTMEQALSEVLNASTLGRAAKAEVARRVRELCK